MRWFKLKQGADAAGTLLFRLERAGDDNVRVTCESLGYEDESISSTVESHAGRLVGDAVEAQGPHIHLCWEELDPAHRRIRRRSVAVERELRGHLTVDKTGIEFLDVADSAPPIWLAADHRSTLPDGFLARVGWTVRPPRLTWRYARDEGGSVVIRVAWECAGLPDAWIRALPERELAGMECEFEPGPTVRMVHVPGRSGRLRLEGRAPVLDGGLPLNRRVRCRVPLVLAEAGEEPRHEVDADIAAEFQLRDLRALVEGEKTCLVSEDDLDRAFTALAEADLETVLPDTFPAGSLRQLPWEVRVTPSHTRSDARRWELSAVPAGSGLRGVWSEVEWEGSPPLLGITLCDHEAAEDAPRIRKIHDRRVRRAWEVDGGESRGLLRLVRPVWTALDTSLPELDGADRPPFRYHRRVRVALGGNEEWFETDSGSELPEQPLLLDPLAWRVDDAHGAPVDDAEVYGKVGGGILWRVPFLEGAGSPPLPSEWAAGGGIVLVARGDRTPTPNWGGFWIPEPVPWDRLRERSPSVRGEAGDLEIHVAPGQAELWIYLWGFLARYRRRTLRLDLVGVDQEVAAWVLDERIPLFPSEDAVLLRAFCPLGVVEEPGRFLRLLLASPRPTLSLGAELCATGGGTVRLTLDGAARICWARGAPSDVPGLLTAAGGTAELSSVSASPSSVWVALAQGEPSTAGWLLSRSPSGAWWFRGFYAAPGSTVVLGEPRDGTDRKVRLTELPAAPRRQFSRRRTAAGEESWSGEVPRELRAAVDAAARADLLARFRSVTEQLPDGGTRTTYMEVETLPERTYGIRVWELPPEAAEAGPGGRETTTPDEERPVYVG